jgi:hypothetical protein
MTVDKGKAASDVWTTADLMPEIAEIAGVNAEALARMPRADIQKLLLKAVAMVRRLTSEEDLR